MSVLLQTGRDLGHIIDKGGLHPNPAKTREIDRMPYPQSVKELQAFLGVINFYRRFLPDIAKVCAPLYDLLKANTKFVWSKQCKHAVDALKAGLKQDTCLAHFDPQLKTKLTVDASPVGVGAVLSQVTTQGIERPIEFASRRLSETEQRYSQLDREAVAILYGVKKFHHFLYGRHFTLVTDNKPLHHIFDPNKGIPVMAANRLQRIALTLSGYTFDIVNIKSKTNIADYFSRNPSENKIEEVYCPEGVFLNYVQQNNKIHLNIETIRTETQKDKLLQMVCDFIRSGWPSVCADKVLRPFFDRRLELSADSGCVFWGHRLIIPRSLQSEVVQYLHASHLGIAKMKGMARECCWWPTQSADIEKETKSCEACLMSRPDPAKQILKSWNWPENPWTRVHIDFFGPFMNRWCLIVVDSYSKWVECIDMGKNTTSKATIGVLKQIFARFGLPEILVSDNGTAFVSGEFQLFLERNSIKHITSPVGHPASNGQAENCVKVIKAALKRGLYQTRESDFHDVLNRFLLDYRNAVHSSTGVSPAQLMFGRQLRTRLDILNPKREADRKSDTSVREKVNDQQVKQRIHYRGNKRNKFKNGDQVIVKDYSIPGRVSWTKAEILEKLGQQTFRVKTIASEKIWKRHANQMVACYKANTYDPGIPKTLLDPLVSQSLDSNINRNEEKYKNSVGSPDLGNEQNITNLGNIKLKENEAQSYKYNLRSRVVKEVNKSQ